MSTKRRRCARGDGGGEDIDQNMYKATASMSQVEDENHEGTIYIKTLGDFGRGDVRKPMTQVNKRDYFILSQTSGNSTLYNDSNLRVKQAHPPKINTARTKVDYVSHS